MKKRYKYVKMGLPILILIAVIGLITNRQVEETNENDSRKYVQNVKEEQLALEEHDLKETGLFGSQETESSNRKVSESFGVLPSDYNVNDSESDAIETESKNIFDEYIIPDSGSRYLTESDIEGFDLKQVRFAINEIYARHGRAFQTEDLNEYFSSKSWYTPLYSADEFAAIEDSVMNDYEKENIKFLATIRDNANGSASSQFEAGWIYGTYETHDGGIDAGAEIGWYSDTGEDYISLSGATSDGRALAEFTGTVVSSNGNSYTAVDENGDVIDFTYNGVDAIEITNGDVSDGGLYFPGFEGTYQKTADLSHNVS